VPTVLKSGSFNFLEPSGPVQASNGIVLTFNGNYFELQTKSKTLYKHQVIFFFLFACACASVNVLAYSKGRIDTSTVTRTSHLRIWLKYNHNLYEILIAPRNILRLRANPKV
jgi:hypothetical protein